ncbi:MAG: ABC transporter permease [Chloroherpetonaceae bacterium]|nr:ABC transporter permease [Chloroherpetonaceae bacterium]MDW8437448.1 ABC transporter permease [Chloroherpetonaceae bacterium]
MESWFGAIALGLCYGFLAMGVFITMRIYNFPDITVDGSLTLGASVTATMLVSGAPPVLAPLFAAALGFVAGALTGVIHAKLRVNGLLSGILVTTALYSINLRIMGKANVPLLAVQNILTPFERTFSGVSKYVIALVFFLAAILAMWALLALLFKTNFGLAMRATGDNETMIAAQGVDTDFMKIIGIGLSNALVALSGSLVAQYQGFADIGMGIGIIVFGLASVIIGESLAFGFGGRAGVTALLMFVVAGAIVFRLLVALALSIGLDPIDFKLITALFVLAAVGLPQLRARLK